MFICFVLHFCIVTLIHTLSTRGRRGELKFGSLHPHVQGELAFVQGSFLAVFGVEFTLWSLCFAWLVTFLCLSLVLVMS
jgi:hypothetical protein